VAEPEPVGRGRRRGRVVARGGVMRRRRGRDETGLAACPLLFELERGELVERRVASAAVVPAPMYSKVAVRTSPRVGQGWRCTRSFMNVAKNDSATALS
jgi:hypothetical protein